MLALLEILKVKTKNEGGQKCALILWYVIAAGRLKTEYAPGAANRRVNAPVRKSALCAVIL
jgi:hypothetical protein